jgi:hypothetical protein
MEVINNAPMHQHKTNRGLLKMILLGIITFGIYPIVVYSLISSEINTVASRHDGKHTTHYCLMYFIFSWLTLGIAAFVWNHRIVNRMGNELRRRGIGYEIGASDFWLWGVLGSLIVVGPFVYIHKFLKAMNLINEDYNING